MERFVNRVWRLYQEQLTTAEVRGEIPEDLNRAHHQALKSTSEDIEIFKFNTAIARVMEFVNAIYLYLSSYPADKRDGRYLKQCLENLAIMMAPLAPHLGEELWNKMGYAGSVFHQTWPQYDPKALVEDRVEIAMQINGRLRGTVKIPRGCDEETAANLAAEIDSYKKYIGASNIRKRIYIKDKLISFVTGGG
jgi:leucyl-tRNA synthetase